MALHLETISTVVREVEPSIAHLDIEPIWLA
jgi:hypothetical protein